MAPKVKGPKLAGTAPVITTHHSLPVGGAPGGSNDESEVVAEPVLTRPKKLILQPLHESIGPDPDRKSATKPKEDEDGPLVLESAADTEVSVLEGAAKPAELPTDKIELPLEDVSNEVDEESDKASVRKASGKAATESEPTAGTIKDPGEGAAAEQAIDPNEARSQKAEALMLSGKYQVRIHESTRSRTGFIIGLVVTAVVLLMFVYYAVAEQMIDVGYDAPAFWR